MPSLEQKDLSIELKDQILTIKDNKQQEQEKSDKHYFRNERCYRIFEWVFTTPNDANNNAINTLTEK